MNDIKVVSEMGRQRVSLMNSPVKNAARYTTPLPRLELITTQESTSERMPHDNSESATLADLLSATIQPDLGVDLADLFAHNEIKREELRRRALWAKGRRRGKEWRRWADGHTLVCGPKAIFIADAIRLPLIIVVVVVIIVVCRRYLSMTTMRRFSQCPIANPSADASLMPLHRLSANRISPLFILSVYLSSVSSFSFSLPLSFEQYSKATLDGSAIKDNHAPSAIRFVRTHVASAVNSRDTNHVFIRRIKPTMVLLNCGRIVYAEILLLLFNYHAVINMRSFQIYGVFHRLSFQLYYLYIILLSD